MSSQAKYDPSQFLSALLSAGDREKSAQDLAAALGAHHLILFMPDPEINTLLPAVGFPQTLINGGLWRAFFKEVSDLDFASARLPSPYTGQMENVLTLCGDLGVVLALIGGHPDLEQLREFKPHLSLAGHALSNAQQLRLADARLQQMHSEVRSSRALTKVLDHLRRELEDALEAASREATAAETAKRDLLSVNEELAMARDQALAASHSKGAFLANMSHELRTPLTAIIGYSEMLQDEITEPHVQQDLQRIHDSGQHLLTLVNDILDMAKIESGHVVLHPEDFGVEEVITEATEIVTPQINAGNNQCLIEITPGIPQLHTDRHKLRQVLLNLLSNASKFTRDGTIIVSASYDLCLDRVTLSVRDTGIGIAAGALPRLFKEFSQLDDSSTKTAPGTGLGLAISKRLCELLGGQISVESKPGKGSIFLIQIPPQLSSEKPKHV